MKKIITILLLIPTFIMAQLTKKELKIISKAQSEITTKSDKFSGELKFESPSFGKGLLPGSSNKIY